MRIQDRHYSGINFDWVIVRDLRFSDNPAKAGFSVLSDLAADIHIESSLDASKRICRSLVRLSLEPSAAQREEFQVISATVEGQFSVVGGAEPSVNIEVFANHQAPAILMPFLREAIASATARSRLGQVLVPPINVVAVISEMEVAKGSAAPAALEAKPPSS